MHINMNFARKNDRIVRVYDYKIDVFPMKGDYTAFRVKAPAKFEKLIKENMNLEYHQQNAI